MILRGWWGLIITGSRKWPEDSIVHRYLIQTRIVGFHTRASFQGCGLVVYHGESPEGGADKVADNIVRTSPFFGYSLKVHPFPADWEKYGRRAGPIRNTEMVEYALAQNHDRILGNGFYFEEPSRGTKHCIDVMDEHGIKVDVFDDKGQLVDRRNVNG